MGFILLSGGGGSDTSIVTAGANDVLKGKVIVNANGDPINGQLELTGNAGTGDVVKGKTFYNTNAKGKLTGTLALSGNAGAGDVVSGKTFYGNNLTKQTGTLALSGNASAADVVSGKTFYGNNLTKQTGTLALSGNAGAGDVLSGKTFYGNSLTKQSGTLALSGNASAADVLSGKTFYSNNAKSKLTGTMGTMAGGTYSATTSQQTISCSGKKMTSNIIINALPNIRHIEYVNEIVGDRSYKVSNGFSTSSETFSIVIDDYRCSPRYSDIFVFQLKLNQGVLNIVTPLHIFLSVQTNLTQYVSFDPDVTDRNADVVKVQLIKTADNYIITFTTLIGKNPPASSDGLNFGYVSQNTVDVYLLYILRR